MIKLASGINILWVGTHATIPTGFSRKTALDGYFFKGVNSGDANLTPAGSDTHTHSATGNHSHTMGDHTHTISFGASTGGSQNTGSGSSAARSGHTHANLTSGAVSSGGELSSVASTYTSVSHVPPYFEVIVIESDGSLGVPSNAVLFYENNDDITSKGFYNCDGNNGTANMDGFFLKVVGAGGDAGSSVSNNSYHNHSLSHTHSVASHSHGSVTSGGVSGETNSDTDTPYQELGTHTHAVVLSGSDAISSADATLDTTGDTVLPSFKYLRAVQNKSGVTKDPVIKMVALWTGAVADIPTGWSVKTSMYDVYPRVGNSSILNGTTGGSNTHTHSSNSHTHSSTGHTHSGNATHPGNSRDNTNSSGAFADTGGGVHAYTTDSKSPTYSSATTSAGSSSNEPAHTQVIFITYNGIYEVSVTDTVTVEDVETNSVTRLISKTETVTVSENAFKPVIYDPATTRTISKTEEVYVSETIIMPQPTDIANSESVSVTERVSIKLSSALDSFNYPSFDVSGEGHG